MFENFDFKVLNDPEFKEDAVREEIITPLLKELGYKASGKNKIIRSKSLTHPFVYIGSKKRKVNIIPDYLLEIDNEYKLILDAKAPNENILKGKNTEQAFCYSIHPDVRVKFYALCNGRELTVFDVSKIDPILHIEIPNINEEWEEVRKAISPIGLTKPHVLSFYPDFGLYMLKSGWKEDSEFHFYGAWVNMIAKIEDDKYTLFSNLKFTPQDIYAASFDFDKNKYKQLLEVAPKDQVEEIKHRLSRQPFKMGFDKTNTFEIGIHSKFSKNVITNENESYLPLEIIKFESMPYSADLSRMIIQ